MENSLINSLDAIGGSFDNFGDMFKGLLSDLNKKLLQFAMKDLGITGQGGLLQSAFGSIGSIFGSGGGMGSALSSIGSMFGGFFADGGKLKPGQFGVVGERGPELAFAGHSPLNIMPNGSGLTPAPITVNMNIQTQDANSFRRSQNQIAAEMARSIQGAQRNL